MKRILFGGVLVLLLLALVEGASYVAFWLLDDEPFRPSRVRARQEQRQRENPLLDAMAVLREEHDLGRQVGALVVHPYLGYVLPPEAWDRWPGAHLDEDLLGASEWNLDMPGRADDEILLGIFGGSVARIFARQGVPYLEQALESWLDGRRLRVLVGAGGGYKQPQQVMALSYLLALGGELDLLINIDGFNEVALHPAENARQGVFPAYPRRWAQRVQLVPDGPTRIAVGRISDLNQRRQQWAQAASSRWWGVPITGRLIWSVRDRLLTDSIADLSRFLVEYDPGRHSYQTHGPPYEPADDARMMADLVGIWERGSRVLQRICRAHDIEYFHVLQPNQYVEGSKELTAEERRDAWREDAPYRTGAIAGYPLLRGAGAALRADGIRFLDLTDVFAEVEETLYIDTCCHFNERGNEILAQAIAEAILFELGPSAGYQTGRQEDPK